MTASELRRKYLKFFEEKGHKIIPSTSLVPENDPTTLFTSAGMQPMIPYLLGETHPEGKRITDSQKVFRSTDIEEVGDNRHLTFYEMLGNWSFGDYFKKEQLSWFLEFLTKELKIDKNKLYITVFKGDNSVSKDLESVQIWKELGISEDRISFYGAEKNWWSRSGPPENMPPGEIGGPDSEVFYEFVEVEHNPEFGEKCHPNCDCGRFVEIGNSVFIQYIKQSDGSLKELAQKNVDFGGGLERIMMAVNNSPDIFTNDLFLSLIDRIAEETGKTYEECKKEFRIISDHIKAAVFLIKDGVVPSNKLQGYILRRLLRRTAVKINSLKPGSMSLLPKLVDPVMDIYEGTGYFQTGDWDPIRKVIEEEIAKFEKTINKGLKEIEKIDQIDGKIAFDLYQTYGFPLEITTEIFAEKGQQIDLKQFQAEFEKHKELSQTAAAGMFKGGLADHSEETTKLHTATHMLQAALKQILGKEVGQRGSNITAERLRFDFNYPQKLTEQQLKKVEDLVNQNIQADHKVWFDIEDREQAIQEGATTNYGEKYPDKVKVYKIGEFSMELCGGPHIDHTGALNKFKIDKEESASAGIRRIYAHVE